MGKNVWWRPRCLKLACIVWISSGRSSYIFQYFFFFCWSNSRSSALLWTHTLLSFWLVGIRLVQHLMSIDLFLLILWEFVLWPQQIFASLENQSLVMYIGLRLSDLQTWKCTSYDHFLSELSSMRLALNIQVIHVVRSQLLVDRSARLHYFYLVAFLQLIKLHFARSRSFVDRTGRLYQ